MPYDYQQAQAEYERKQAAKRAKKARTPADYRQAEAELERQRAAERAAKQKTLPPMMPTPATPTTTPAASTTPLGTGFSDFRPDVNPLRSGYRNRANIPEGASIAERNAQGEITVYEKDGVRYYTPESTMWGAGYRTSEEYYSPQGLGVAGSGTGEGAAYAKSAYVPVVTGDGIHHISRREYEELTRIDNDDDRKAELRQLLGLSGDVKILARNPLLNDYLTPDGYVDVGQAIADGIDDPREFGAVGIIINTRDISLGVQKSKESEFQRERYQEAANVLKPYTDKDGNIDLVAAGDAINSGDRSVERALHFMNIRKSEIEQGREIATDKRRADTARLTAIAPASFETASVELPDGNHILVSELSRIKQTNPRQYETLVNEGFDAYSQNVNDAMATLEPYRNEDGSYNLFDAMYGAQKAFNHRDFEAGDKISNSIYYLFSPDTIQEVAKKRSAALNAVPASKDEKGIWQAAIGGAAVMTAPGYQATQGTPFPYDDAAVIVAEILLTVGLIGKGIYDQLKKKEVKPSELSVAIPTSEGYKIVSTTKLLDEMRNLPPSPDRDRKLDELLKELPPFPVSDTRAESLVRPTTLPTDDKRIQEMTRVPGIPLSDSRLEELTQSKGDLPSVTEKKDAYIMRVTAEAERNAEKVKQAADDLREVERKYKLNGSELNATMGDIETYLERQQISDYANEQTMRNAYTTWWQKRQALMGAWTSYIASVNPTPVSGNYDSELAESIAAEQLLDSLTSGKGKVSARQKARYQAIISELMATKVDMKTGTAEATSARTTVAPTTVSEKTLVSPLTMTAPGTRTATKVATNTATAVNEATKPVEATATADITATQTGRGGNVPPYKKPGKNATDKQKRKFLESVPWVVARRRGAPKGGPMWLVDFGTGPKDKLVLRGKPPQGAKEVTGDGSLAKSATFIKGKPPKDLIYRRDTGAVDDIISVDTKRNVRVKSVKDRMIK